MDEIRTRPMMGRKKEGSIDTDPVSVGRVQLLLFPCARHAHVSVFYTTWNEFLVRCLHKDMSRSTFRYRGMCVGLNSERQYLMKNALDSILTSFRDLSPFSSIGTMSSVKI